jgi:glutamate--cysteine ligase
MDRLVVEPALTPSARVLEDLRTAGAGFFEFSMGVAVGHRDYFAKTEPIPPARLALLDAEAAQSIARQRAIEAADDLSFDEYVAHYFADG